MMVLNYFKLKRTVYCKDCWESLGIVKKSLRTVIVRNLFRTVKNCKRTFKGSKEKL